MQDGLKSGSVSVVIPAYNRADMTLEALWSVLVQSRPPRELIVVDDGSTDDTVDRVERAATLVAAAGVRTVVEVVRLSHCGRPGAVRNRGVDRAGGDWIAFLDSDDLWASTKLEESLAAAGDTGRDLVHTRELWLRNGREISQRSMTHAREGDIFADALVKCIVGPSTVVLRRGLFVEAGGFREDLEVAEDYELWLRILRDRSVAYVDAPLTVKRAGHGDQLSERYGRIEEFRIAALLPLVESGFFRGGPAAASGPTHRSSSADAIAAEASPPARQALAEAELARKCRVFAAGAEKRGRMEEAARYRRIARSYEV